MESKRLQSRARHVGAHAQGLPPARRPRWRRPSVALFIIAALLNLLLVTAPAAVFAAGRPEAPSGPGWTVGTIEGNPVFDWLEERSIALDPAGRPHIVYGGNFLYHAWLDNGTWQRETVDASTGTGYFPSLVIDAQGFEHISYNSDYSGTLKYAYRDAAGWHVETVDGGPAAMAGEFSSLALDSAGRPHIAYCAYSEQLGCYQLKYASWTGAAWDIQTLTNQAGDKGVLSGYSAKLVLDAADRPHIIDIESANAQNPSGILRYATWKDSAWQFQTVDSPGDVRLYASLALDAAGQPRVSYYSGSTSTLYYAYLCATGWIRLTVDSAQNMDSALVMNAAGNAEIAYSTTGAGIKLARWTGAGWDIQVVDDDENSGKYARYIGLVLDASGHEHLSYDLRDRSIHYAHRIGTAWEHLTVDVENQPGGGYNSVVIDAAGRANVAYMDVLNGLRYAVQDNSGWTAETVDQICCGPVDAALDPGGNPGIAYSDLNGLVKFAHRAAGSWQVESVDSGSRYFGPTLAFDRAGHPAIAYTGAADGSLHYAYKAGNTWAIQTVDALGLNASLVFDSAGNPAIAYTPDFFGEVKYAQWSGNQWTVQVVDAEGSQPSLALDGSGQPAITYASQAGLKLARRTGQAWQIEPIDTAARDPHLAFDTGGNPMISYSSGPDDSSLKFAQLSAGAWRTETVDGPGYVGEPNDLAVTPAGSPFISYYGGIDRILKFATRPAQPASFVARFVVYLPALVR